MLLGFVDSSLLNKRLLIDPNSVEDNNLEDVRGIYGKDYIGKIEDFLPARNKDK